MAFGSGRGWPTYVGTGLLILFSPVLLVAAWTVLVASPYDVAVGLAQVFSGRDVVQMADGEETAISLFLLLLALLGMGWLLRLRTSIVVVACGFLLVWPIVAVLAAGVEYGLQTALAGRGYDYCTFHVMSTGRGEGGTYVYVRRALPGACEAVRGIFPPHHLVPDRRESFDIPVAAR